MADPLDPGTVTPTPPSDPSPNPPAAPVVASPPADPAAPPAAPAAVDPSKPADPPADPPAEIEYTAFAMPDGVELDQAAMDRAIPILKEIKLPQEQAQKLATFYATELQTQVQAALTPQRMAEYEAARTAERASQWAEDVKADPDIGGAHLDETHALIKDGIAKFGTPKLAEALNETGLGNHPELVRLFRNIGAQTREDRGGLPPGGGAVPKSLAERLYGKPG